MSVKKGFLRCTDRVRVSLDFSDVPSMTKQSSADECDINSIMRKWEKTGVLPVGRSGGQYLDVSDLGSYQESLDIVSRADSMFSALPAFVRERFDNDPALFLDFAQNPANSDALVSMGLATKPVVDDSPAAVPGQMNIPGTE